MRPTTSPSVHPSPPAEPESLEQLIGDCREMAAQWKTPPGKARPAPAAVAPAGRGGITVPAASAHVVAGMAEFGD